MLKTRHIGHISGIALIGLLIVSCGGSDQLTGVDNSRPVVDSPHDDLPDIDMSPAQKLGVQADQVVLRGDGAEMEIFYAIEGWKMRSEVRSPEPTVVAIERWDRLVGWMLFPKFKQYIEEPLDPADLETELNPPATELPFDDQIPGYQCFDRGEEIIAKAETLKKECIYVIGGESVPIGLVWLEKQTGFVMRYTATDLKTIVLDTTRFETGDVPDSLFEVPAGYVKVETNPYD